MDGAVGWLANGGCGVKPNGFAIPKIIIKNIKNNRVDITKINIICFFISKFK